MSEELQGLLDRINAEGIEKAEAEKNSIIAEAKARAESIIAEAKGHAAEYEERANAAAKAGQERANAAIRQAARDAVIALRSELLAKLNLVARECAAAALTPELMGDIILEMARSYAANSRSGEEPGIEVLLPKREADAVSAILKKALLAKLREQPTISLTNEFNAGMQISFKGDDVFLDFSDEALADVLCKFVGAKLAAVIKG